MFRLPVSGLPVVIRQPTGREELLLQETRRSPLTLALTLLERLVQRADGEAADWASLTVTDIEALLLLIRWSLLGEMLRGETRCAQKECGAKADVSFRIGEFLASHASRRLRMVEDADAEGWFRLAGEETSFRLPDGHTLKLVERKPMADRALMELCVRPSDAPARTMTRVEKAMQALAPVLSQKLQGECPECGSAIEIHFDVKAFVLDELRDQAAGLYEEIHLLALHYKWHEEEILAMPRARRMRYAAMLRGEGAVA